jgi:Leucine Rich repeat
VILASLGLVLIGFGWKVGLHLTTAYWLEANHYVVVWGIDRDNWKEGGASTVRYSAPSGFLVSTRPDLDLKYLTNLHHLEELDLSTLPRLRDSDMVDLDKLSDLRRLNLDRSRLTYWMKIDSGSLTDVTLARIGRLSRLQELNLGGHKITDSGLKNLTSLDKLQSLDLVETEITDAGLEYLKSLRGLKSVDLMRTKVTAQGVNNFEASMPGVKVVADPPSPAPRLTTGPKP